MLWTLYFGLGFGVWYSHLESEARKLWVQKGSRLEDEKDFLEKHYQYGFPPTLSPQAKPNVLSHVHPHALISCRRRIHNRHTHTPQHSGLDRPVSWQITHEGETDNGKSVMTREHILELYEVDKIMLDMRPSANRRFMVIGGCVDPTLTNVTCNAKSLCGWDADLNTCLFHDKFGLLPSQEQRNGTTIDLLGVKWGWREICNEAPSPPVDATAKNPSPVANLRAPCSKQMTPMDCFKEHAYSQQSGTLELLGWSRNHPVSNRDTHLYHSVFKNPCHMWNGGFNAKDYTLGGYHLDGPTNSTIQGWKMVYPIHHVEAFKEKYNNFIMKHPRSRIFYRQLGFPETISSAEAETIIEAFEQETRNNLFKMQEASTFKVSKVRHYSDFHLDQIIEDASDRNKSYVIIGLALLLVVVWGFLLAGDLVFNRLLLGFAGVLCIALSVFATLGFTALVKTDYNGLTLQVLPYVSMGLGIDDMFVLIHYFDTNPRRNVVLRMREAYAHAGPSICTTSIINACMFFLGTAIPIKALIDFSIAAGIAVLANFFVIILAFGGCLALDARRIQAKRFDILICVKRAEPLRHTAVRCEAPFKMVMAFFRFAATTIPGNAIFLTLTAGLLAVSIYGCTEIELGLPIQDFLLSGSHDLEYFDMRDKHFPGQANGFFGTEGTEWQTRDAQIKLNRLIFNTALHPQNSFGQANGTQPHHAPTFLISGTSWWALFRRFAMQYPGGPDERNPCDICYPNPLDPDSVWKRMGWNTHAGFTKPIPPHNRIPGLKDMPAECTINPDRFYELLELFLGRKTCLEAGQVPPADTIANLRDPKFYMHARCRGGGAAPAYEAPTCRVVESSISASNWFFTGSTPLTPPATGLGGHGLLSSYLNDITFTNASGQTRMAAWQTSVMNTPVDPGRVNEVLTMMEETRDLLDNSGLSCFATGLSYYFGEQYRFVVENSRTLIISAICLSLVASTIILVSPTIALIQTAVISCSVTAICAALPATDLFLNSISMASIMVGVGINVETAVHISRAFLVATKADMKAAHRRRGGEEEEGIDYDALEGSDLTKERVMFALEQMSVPVFNGAFTSFMSVVVLAFSDTRFFRVYFFGFYALMILISMWHAYILLPILLTWFGPNAIPHFLVEHDERDGPELIDGIVDKDDKEFETEADDEMLKERAEEAEVEAAQKEEEVTK